MTQEANHQNGTSDSLHSIEEKYRQEFTDDAGERLSSVSDALEALRNDGADQSQTIAQLRQDAHNLKGTGGTSGFPLITTISHRLENYLADLKELDDRNRLEVQIYVDVLSDIVSTGQDLTEFEIRATVRDLPPKPGFDVDDIEVSEIEVMLAMPRGYSNTFCHPATPSLLIAPALMDGLSGMDLANALRGISSTQSVPIALLTSMSKDDPHLASLPAEVPVILKGQQFGDDLADALESLGIT